MVRANPAMLEYGHNLFRFDGDLTAAIADVLDRITPLVSELSLSRQDRLLLRGGHVELSEIDLAADFIFPSYMAMSRAVSSLTRSWHWPWNRQRNVEFHDSLRFKHKGWVLRGYDKAEQVRDTVRAPARWMLETTHNRYRVEVRIRRPDLHRLAERLGRPDLDLCRAGDWTPDLYGPAFDYYISRLRPRKGKGQRCAADVPDLLELFRRAGAVPRWKRRCVK